MAQQLGYLVVRGYAPNFLFFDERIGEFTNRHEYATCYTKRGALVRALKLRDAGKLSARAVEYFDVNAEA